MTAKPIDKYFAIGILLSLGLFFLLRLPQVITNQFPFVFDMGRDHLWVRNLVELKIPTLVGPWGSLAGVYFGPFWYYFLSLPYLLSGGDPRASVMAVMLVNLAALIFLTKFFKKNLGVIAAVIFAFVFALSPHNINITTYPFHANLLPLTSGLIFWVMYQISNGQNHFLWLAALAASLNFHLEPAAAIFSTLTLLLFGLYYRKKLSRRSIFNSLIAFAIPFIPQVIFELRHNFIQSKSVLLYFQGQNQSLEGKLPFLVRLVERLRKFSELFSASDFPGVSPLVASLILLGIVIFIYRAKKTRSETVIFNLAILNLLVPLLAYMFIFPPELKGWYLYGLSIFYFILVSLFFSKLLDFKIFAFNTKAVIYWPLVIVYLFWLGQLQHRLPDLGRHQFIGPEVLSSQLEIVDYIYSQAQGQPFSVYTYTPPIYDYQYQYLFWLAHKQKHLPLPVEYSYQPGETSYLPYKDRFVNTESSTPTQVFLIIEPESDKFRLQGWLGHYSLLSSVSSQTFDSGISVETRLPPPRP